MTVSLILASLPEGTVVGILNFAEISFLDLTSGLPQLRLKHDFLKEIMLEMFLLWSALLVVLFMLVATPLPDRLRAFGLVAAVMTVWLLWALYGVEFLANLKWPLKDESVANTAAVDPPTARLGQVGDLFGGVNSLFAALAFSGVGIAAFQQWKSTRIAFKQSIEATFFSAVDLHHRIADELRFDRVSIFPDEQQGQDKLILLAGIDPQKRAVQTRPSRSLSGAHDHHRLWA